MTDLGSNAPAPGSPARSSGPEQRDWRHLARRWAPAAALLLAAGLLVVLPLWVLLRTALEEGVAAMVDAINTQLDPGASELDKARAWLKEEGRKKGNIWDPSLDEDDDTCRNLTEACDGALYDVDHNHNPDIDDDRSASEHRRLAAGTEHDQHDDLAADADGASGHLLHDRFDR